MTNVIVRGNTRRPSRVDLGADRDLGLHAFGDLQVSQFLPPLAMLANEGRLFVLEAGAGTAKAPVVAPPTTSPEWALYNFSAVDSLVLIKASVTLKSGTAGLGLAMLGAAAIGPQTAVTSDYSGTIKSAPDGSGKQPQAYLTNNPTLIGGTPPWMALEGTKVNTVATDSVGDTLTFDAKGMFIARPGGGMVAIEVLGETGTSALYYPSFLVAMLQLPY